MIKVGWGGGEERHVVAGGGDAGGSRGVSGGGGGGGVRRSPCRRGHLQLNKRRGGGVGRINCGQVSMWTLQAKHHAGRVSECKWQAVSKVKQSKVLELPLLLFFYLLN
jgi:hypothetical protein